MDDSFNDDVYYPDDSGDSSKKDRFKDIRPDEFKALGIDVKVCLQKLRVIGSGFSMIFFQSIVPKKDFYAMTREERAAAVAAEFEAIDALGPKKEEGYIISVSFLDYFFFFNEAKALIMNGIIMDFSCRVNPYHLNTAKMKRVMKSILSNPLLAYDKVLYTRRALLARRRAAERHKILRGGPEVYFKKLDRTLDSSLGPIAEKILEEHNPMDITAVGNSDAYCNSCCLLGELLFISNHLDPIDVLEAVTYRNLDDNGEIDEAIKKRYDSTSAGVEESMRQFAAEVRQADFKVQGLFFSGFVNCVLKYTFLLIALQFCDVSCFIDCVILALIQGSFCWVQQKYS
ncbi:hypothetical protein TELCIR_08909 [Teladorsagia circumcincta]|uniref:Uncharacterized protein n=1 Tax=Teladorsagia circumcincta TaxID=45464 RepID=A0A2G9UGJ4_TELCI|nr:hypothetical protein TELCIR_08909 [Teladorsagia circumcincta]